jgi:hypothetical protein
MKTGRIVLTSLIAVLCTGALYAGAIAAGVLEVGPEPGDQPPGGFVVAIAIFALFFGGVALVLASVSVQTSAPFIDALLPLVSLAAGAFAAAHFLSYDPYDAPAENRYADSAAFATGWYVALGVFAVAAAFLARRWPRLGLLVTGAYLIFACGMVVLSGLH